ncbi:hypothetical protein V6C27_13905 [Peptococcaceae bacterium 1198_IL3148]
MPSVDDPRWVYFCSWSITEPSQKNQILYIGDGDKYYFKGRIADNEDSNYGDVYDKNMNKIGSVGLDRSKFDVFPEGTCYWYVGGYGGYDFYAIERNLIPCIVISSPSNNPPLKVERFKVLLGI